MARAKGQWRTVRVVVELRTREWDEKRFQRHVHVLLNSNAARGPELTLPMVKRWSRWWPAMRASILEPWLRRGEQG